MNVFVLLNTKEDSLEEVCNQAVLGAIDFHSREKILWKSMVPQNCSVSHILQNIFLCVQQNKDIHTDLEILEGEIHFWVNYPFNISTRFLKHILLAGDIDFFP